MTTETQLPPDSLIESPDVAQPRRFEDLPPAAQRALREAEERRAAASATHETPREINGRGGLEPVRYGDWEIKGLTADF